MCSNSESYNSTFFIEEIVILPSQVKEWPDFDTIWKWTNFS